MYRLAQAGGNGHAALEGEPRADRLVAQEFRASRISQQGRHVLVPRGAFYQTPDGDRSAMVTDESVRCLIGMRDDVGVPARPQYRRAFIKA